MRVIHFALLISLAIISVLANPVNCKAQRNVVTWHFKVAAVKQNEATLTFTATVEEPWYIYSQFLQKGGPFPTTFKFKESGEYLLFGKVKEESTPVKKQDQTFDMPVISFEKTAVFTQRIKLKGKSATIIGSVEFMACNGEQCMLPVKQDFKLEVKGMNR